MKLILIILVACALSHVCHASVLSKLKNVLKNTFQEVKSVLDVSDTTLDVVANKIREEIAIHTGRPATSSSSSSSSSSPDNNYLKSLCTTNTCCELGSSDDSCSIKNMPKDETTMVLTTSSGDGSQCIFGDTYGFQVIPGSSDKVLFYFQGGGACWDKATTAAGMCTTTIGPNAPVGVFDRQNDENPFKDYTIVHALYCSGDVWAGQHTADYTHKGNSVTQVGYTNAQVTLNWLKEQVVNGDIGGGTSTSTTSSMLDTLIIMGCSAGSVGTQLWADKLLDAFPAQHAAIIPDSYAGVFPDNTVGPLMKSFGVCETDLVPASLVDDCNAGELDIPTLVNLHIEKYPQYPFAYIQSKIDAVQQSFYIALGLTTRNASAIITPSKFYNGVNDIFSKYNKDNKNFLTFLVDGPMHCFTPMNIMYDTTTAGPYGKRDKKSNEAKSLSEWLAAFPLSSGQSQNTECIGDVTTVSKEGSDEAADIGSDAYLEELYSMAQDIYENKKGKDTDGRVKGFNDRTKYCADTIVPKTFTQQ